MTPTDHLPDWLTDRLPDDAAMGSLRRNRPALYWLTLAVGGASLLMVIQAVYFSIALFPLFAGRAIVATLEGDPVIAGAWLALMGLLGLAFIGMVAAVARWYTAFTSPPSE